jgi:hypothetical protein
MSICFDCVPPPPPRFGWIDDHHGILIDALIRNFIDRWVMVYFDSVHDNFVSLRD